MTTAAPIEVHGLRKVYRTRGRPEVVAVDGLDLRVERGEVFGLLGPNGAGKTTTVEICEGLLTQDAGDVRVLGYEWRGSGQQIRERIGVSLQDTRMFDKLTVRELIELFTCSYPKPRPIDELLETVGLQEKSGARYEHLSGGQKQRLAVATALGGHPELLFLDEPTTGLDPQSRRRLWEVVREFRLDEGGTVLLTTHYMDEAEVLCDRIMIVDHGKCIALGTPKQLIASLGAAHVVEVEATRLRERLGDPAATARLPGVVEQELEPDKLTMTIGEPHVVLPPLLRLLDERSIEPSGIATRHTSLEDVFVHLTGRHLRDGEAKS
jgi:ABC-2 type transport system ATP-binding protein